MFLKWRLLFLIMLVVSCSPVEQKQKNVCAFFINDELVVLNGHVKQIIIEYESITNPGQDYDVVDLNKKGDMTEAIHGFHGTAFSTTYITNYNKLGGKSETINYLIIPKRRRIEDIFHNVKRIDSTKKATQIYIYNNKGNIIRVGYMMNGPISENSYKYNKLGDLAASYVYGELTKRQPEITFFKYDNQHHLIASTRYLHGHVIAKVKYDYQCFDAHGNWIKAVENSEYFMAGRSVQSITITRKINYY